MAIAMSRGVGVLVGVALMLAPSALVAQGAVGGRVSMLEAPGATPADLSETVVYLVPIARHGKPRADKITISMHDRDFVPHVSVMSMGSTVVFQNEDPFQHNAFSTSPAGTFDVGLSDRGTTLVQVMRHSGVFPVFCNIHARMSAFLVVVSTPYRALAGADGSFSIPGVPAGNYTLHAWHERSGEVSRALAVSAIGTPDQAVQLDARGFQRTAHKNKFGQDYTTAAGDRY